MKVLLVDDDRELMKILSDALKKVGFEIAICYDGLSAVDYTLNNTTDLIIMNVDMPRLDGISTLKEIKKNRNIPTILTGTRQDEMDVIYAYESGCIDYIRKPYFIKEIVLKLQNSYTKTTAQVITYGGLEIDPLGRRVYVNKVEQNLTQKEFQLLYYLVKNAGVAIAREKLLNDVWGYGFFGDDRTIDTHIKMLRSSLGNYKDYIKTIRGFGYKFEVK